jgi:histidinol-phosphate aminotransferase
VDLALDGNEGPPPTADPLAGFDAAARTRLVNRYPSAAALQELWASKFRVTPAQLRVTAGADEAIDRIIRTYVGPGREMLTTNPTFEMFARYCALAGGRYVDVPWVDEALPVEALLGRVTPGTGLIAIASPNNPTGTAATGADLARVADGAPDAVVLADLAYVEFADEDPTPLLLTRPNVLVTRTLSKAHGLAGLRVGCAIGPARLIGWLAAAGNPYPVSAVSIAAAAAWLGRGPDEDVSASVEMVRRERQALTDTLASLGVAVLPSQGNFVLARFSDARAVWEGLAERGIGVRWFAGRKGLEDALRIACPGNEAMLARLIEALRDVIS